jgi:hypothetical protein
VTLRQPFKVKSVEILFRQLGELENRLRSELRQATILRTFYLDIPAKGAALSTNPFESPGEFAQPIGQKPPAQGNGLAITGFVLGIVGLGAWCCPLAGFGTSIAGLVLSAKGLPSAQRGLAIAGLVLNTIVLLLSVANMAWGAYLAATGQHPLVNQLQQGAPR